jgi:hypothetical protein
MNRNIDVKFQHSLCTNFKCVAYNNEQITFLKYKLKATLVFIHALFEKN